MAIHPLVTPAGLSPNTGPLATAAWLVARGLRPPTGRWHAEILIDAVGQDTKSSPTTLRVELFSEEWGMWFRHGELVSWIRVTDVPFVHGRDDHGLLARTPALNKLGTLVRDLERRHQVRFQIEAALIQTNLVDAESAIRDWIGAW